MSGKLRFLAVDDDPMFLQILSGLMESMGYKDLVTAKSGPEALAVLGNSANRIDCVLLDIQMPEMNGIEACKRIRALPNHRETPVMMVTTMNGRRYIDAAFSAGAIDYLTKPLDKVELGARLGMLSRLVQERWRARALQSDMNSFSDLPGMNFSFDDAVPLPNNGLLIDYLAMQNYLLTLNRLQLHSHVAIGFRVVGSETVYQRFGRMEYLDYMADAGTAVAAALKRHNFLLAHAGSGEFVSIMNRAQPVNRQEIELDIGAQLQGQGANYGDLGLPMPLIVMGAPQHSGIFAQGKAMLQRARSAVRLAHDAALSKFAA